MGGERVGVDQIELASLEDGIDRSGGLRKVVYQNLDAVSRELIREGTRRTDDRAIESRAQTRQRLRADMGLQTTELRPEEHRHEHAGG
jgi:hypothetical protein